MYHKTRLLRNFQKLSKNAEVNGFLYTLAYQRILERTTETKPDFQSAFVHGFLPDSGVQLLSSGNSPTRKIHWLFPYATQVPGGVLHSPTLELPNNEEPTSDLGISIGMFHWADDLDTYMTTFLSHLKPGSHFIITFLGGNTLQELRESVYHAQEKIYGGHFPLIPPYLSPRDAAGFLQTLPITNGTCDVDTITVKYPSGYHLLRDIQRMGGSSALLETAGGFLSPRFLKTIVEAYEAGFKGPDSLLPATFQLITIEGDLPPQ